MDTRAPTARRAGLNRGAVLDQAVRLSQEHGVEGWSMRDIARSLDVVPSVIYHYYPQKDDLCDAVVEEVCSTVELPDADLGWKEWFTALLTAYRPVFLRCPGVTDRLAMGRITESFLPVIDMAMAKLADAGFGALAPLAYAMIFNVTVSTIGVRNMRTHRAKSGGRAYDMSAVVRRLSAMTARSEGLDVMVRNFFVPLTDKEQENRISEEYFELIIASLLDGVEHVLLPRAAARPDDGGP
ncbi:TetR/AcrR family transcriptional regulator [Actinomyces israelii]|uniref:TetR/AcrR family transcriptional regulator n=1 Tax=Actinomyces israelii TaxID=1659 RepID=UPI002556F5AD|nr:TetR/AcrR family transcriptional regulator [Actinomyces israelii]WKR21577.1 hypothetical protein AIF0345_1498 [Actinomyces israelii]